MTNPLDHGYGAGNWIGEQILDDVGVVGFRGDRGNTAALNRRTVCNVPTGAGLASRIVNKYIPPRVGEDAMRRSIYLESIGANLLSGEDPLSKRAVTMWGQNRRLVHYKQKVPLGKRYFPGWQPNENLLSGWGKEGDASWRGFPLTNEDKIICRYVTDDFGMGGGGGFPAVSRLDVRTLNLINTGSPGSDPVYECQHDPGDIYDSYGWEYFPSTNTTPQKMYGHLIWKKCRRIAFFHNSEIHFAQFKGGENEPFAVIAGRRPDDEAASPEAAVNEFKTIEPFKFYGLSFSPEDYVATPYGSLPQGFPDVSVSPLRAIPSVDIPKIQLKHVGAAVAFRQTLDYNGDDIALKTVLGRSVEGLTVSDMQDVIMGRVEATNKVALVLDCSVYHYGIALANWANPPRDTPGLFLVDSWENQEKGFLGIAADIHIFG